MFYWLQRAVWKNVENFAKLKVTNSQKIWPKKKYINKSHVQNTVRFCSRCSEAEEHKICHKCVFRSLVPLGSRGSSDMRANSSIWPNCEVLKLICRRLRRRKNMLISTAKSTLLNSNKSASYRERIARPLVQSISTSSNCKRGILGLTSLVIWRYSVLRDVTDRRTDGQRQMLNAAI